MSRRLRLISRAASLPPVRHAFNVLSGRGDAPIGPLMETPRLPVLHSFGCRALPLWIRSMETGELREVKLKLRYFLFPRWSPDGTRAPYNRNRPQRSQQRALSHRCPEGRGHAHRRARARPDQSHQWAADEHVFYRRDSAVIERDFVSGLDVRFCGFRPASESSQYHRMGGSGLSLQTVGNPGPFLHAVCGRRPGR